MSADGSLTWTLPRQAEPPTYEHNLAHFRWGPTLRASSYLRDSYSQHHPAFLIDGRQQPGLIEKWVSSFDDRSPWIELRWRVPRTLTRVLIKHAGWREEDAWTSRNYRLACLTGRKGAATLSIAGNALAVVVHSLRCEGTHGLRIDFKLNEQGEPVRVYEIEAWGR